MESLALCRNLPRIHCSFDLAVHCLPVLVSLVLVFAFGMGRPGGRLSRKRAIAANQDNEDESGICPYICMCTSFIADMLYRFATNTSPTSSTLCGGCFWGPATSYDSLWWSAGVPFNPSFQTIQRQSPGHSRTLTWPFFSFEHACFWACFRTLCYL